MFQLLPAIILNTFLAWTEAAGQGTSETWPEDPFSVFDPPGLFLTWEHDPTTSIVIDWHTHDSVETPHLQYRERGADSWAPIPQKNTFPFPFTSHWIHRVRLEGLHPGTEYEFRWGQHSRAFFFRTLPARVDERPVRAVIGGDTRHTRPMMDAMNEVALGAEPDLIVWGGDLAYADGSPNHAHAWLEWFASIKETLITETNRAIPIVVAIGNHEVRGGFVFNREDYRQEDAVRQNMAPYFYGLFAFSDPIAASIRKHWAPLFEGHGVRVAFEHHDHNYKRTYPIRNGLVELDGVVYLGGGSWGVGLRAPTTGWWLKKTAYRHHCVVIDIFTDRLEMRVLGLEAEVIDRHTVGIPVDPPAAIANIFPGTHAVVDGTWSSSWFGRFSAAAFPWIYHERLGWLYSYGRCPRGVWLHDYESDFGWIWAAPEAFPYIYRPESDNWVDVSNEGVRKR